ncbi:hypothetical protein [Thiohalomonas denitrificans]|uniref:Uncharacterized protein n=1 Tax=Thiohalomonas denitrificans TaxID=415747 RepID=A0A1G5QR75_9GAMM|nr:hypothetical protein [Thiohalomonas denitrificans]SCZ64088.1 hypothetical protein SAMN03097708_02561 [Thiohalomonas denitrificans]
MNRARTTLSLLGALTLLLALTGCSPHPAAGNWTATAEDSQFSRLEVTYEGRANLFEFGEEKAGRHCFWSGESKQVISMSCKPAFDTDIEEHYRLNLEGDGTAILMRDDQAVAYFSPEP